MSAEVETGSEEPSLQIQIVRARRACTYAERKWLSKLQEHDFSPWRTAKALGMSKRTAWTFLRRPRVRKVMDLMDQLDIAELGLTRASVVLRYLRLAESTLKRFYRDDGTLKHPTEWDEDDAAAVQEYSFDANGNPRIRLHDTKGANDALAKILKLFGAERVELSGPNGGPIETKRHVDELSDAELEAIARRGRAAPVGTEDTGSLTNEDLAAIVRGTDSGASGATPQEPDAGEVQ